MTSLKPRLCIFHFDILDKIKKSINQISSIQERKQKRTEYRPIFAMKVNYLTFSVLHTGAVRRNFPMQPYSDTEIVVKDWLRNAKDRDGGRKNRMPSNIVQDSD